MTSVPPYDRLAQSIEPGNPTWETVQPAWQKWLGQLRRFASPSGLLLALVLFPLPWIEIQCIAKPNDSPAGTFMKQQQVPDWVVDRIPSGDDERATLLRESGLQAALGSYSYVPKDRNPEWFKQFDALMKPSVLMAMLPMALLAGIIAGFLRIRIPSLDMVLLCCAVTALILLVSQMAIGFPVEQAMAKNIREGKLDISEEGFRVKYTLWLGMALLGVLGAVVLSGADCYARYRLAKPEPLSRAGD